MHAVHPVADEWSDEYIVWAAQTKRVLLTAPLATFLEVAVTDRLRPIVVIDAGAMISPLTVLALRRSGAYWAIWAPDGGFDGLSGYRIGAFTELWTPPETPLSERDRLPGYERPAADGLGVLMFDVHAHGPAYAGTVAGELAEAATAELGGELTWWGPHEPLLEPWSVPAVTTAARAGMPVTAPLHGLGADGSFVDVVVSRTRHGLLEQAKGGVVLGAYPDRIAAPVQRASDALTELASRFRPTIAFVSLAQFDRDPRAGSVTGSAPGPAQSNTGKPVEVPLAVLIGPRAVHDMQLDLASLRQRHDISVLGRARMPSVLVRFSKPDVGLWAQLMAFAHDAGPQRVAAAAGLGGGA